MEKGIEYIKLQMTNLKKDGSDVAMAYYWSLNKILVQSEKTTPNKQN